MLARSNRILWAIAAVVVFFTVAGSAAAQPGRGGPGGGHSHGPGGPGGSGFDFRSMMLRRMDANGNGVLEPGEVSSRAQGFIERMARDSGLDPGRPMPISRLVGSREGGGDPRRPSSSDRGRDDRGRQGDSRQTGEDPYPTVPRFGESTVSGFGVSPATLAGKVVDLEKKYDRRVLEYVQRTMERYDRNKSGILEHDEWAGVSWRSDPRESDLDNDGQLTKAEMAERIAKRYGGRDGSSSSSGPGSGDRSRGDGGRGDGGRGGAFFGFMQGGQMPGRGDFGRAPADRGSREDDDSGPDGASYRVEGSEQFDGRKSFRSRGQELPYSWQQKDADHDGQIRMAEFASYWSEGLVAEFNRLDRNRDGVLTPKECSAPDSTPAVEPSREATVSGDESPSGSGSEDPGADPAEQPDAASQEESQSASEPGAAGLDPGYQQYAEGLIRKYDKNGDGVLTADEWSEMSKSPEPADTDHNGRLTATEYTLWLMKE